MKLDSIATFLEDKKHGKKGVSIFIGRMPAEKNGILLREGVGGMMIDYELPSYRKGRFVIATRHDRYDDAKSLMERVIAELTIQNKNTTDFEGMMVNYFRPRHEPIDYPTSVADKREFVVNIDACYVLV